MRFRIFHRTGYHYNRPVRLSCHELRVVPRNDPGQVLLASHVKIDPVPVRQSCGIDCEGNVVHWLWFDRPTESLLIDVSLTVETLRSNAFDYLLPSDMISVPFHYPPECQGHLTTYLSAAVHPSAQRFTDSILASDRDTLGFLSDLNLAINEFYTGDIRESGEHQAAEETLARRQGVCRDLTVLFTECCRAVGIAARFVSGYQKGEPGPRKRYLHAWPEVYLPNGGWRGYDPTHARAVSDGHVAVAGAAVPARANPVNGGFVAPDGIAAARLSVELDIHVGDNA